MTEAAPKPPHGSALRPLGASRLIVKRDQTTSGRNRWRLAFDDGPDATVYVYAEGECSAIYHRTMADAIAYGERRYGERAVRGTD